MIFTWKVLLIDVILYALIYPTHEELLQVSKTMVETLVLLFGTIQNFMVVIPILMVHFWRLFVSHKNLCFMQIWTLK